MLSEGTLMAKDTTFGKNFTINCGGKLMLLDRPKIMGILNVTPDSFFDGGRYNNEDALLSQAEKLLKEGADLLDIGAFSTRPGAAEVSLEEERGRMLPAVEALHRNFPGTVLSIDTYRSQVARETVAAGAHMINDISGGTLDDQMFKTIADLQVPYILMHIKGTPQNMQDAPNYEDVTQEVLYYFSEKIAQLRALGVNDIIVDPGFGFGKTIAHNYQLMAHLELFHSLRAPLLVGISRKSMIWRPLEISPEEALNGTSVLNTLAIQHGAHFLRVHDVKEAAQVRILLELLPNN